MGVGTLSFLQGIFLTQGSIPVLLHFRWILYHLSHQGSIVMVVLTKKDAQCESCELSFIWGKMRTATRETAPQIILRNCSKEVVGEDQESRYKILVKAKFSAIKRLFYKRFCASHEELLSS